MADDFICPGCGHDEHKGFCHCGCLDDRVGVARETFEEPRARLAGYRMGKWGYGAERSPYSAGDMSPLARAWRIGWTYGHAVNRVAIERVESEDALTDHSEPRSSRHIGAVQSEITTTQEPT